MSQYATINIGNEAYEVVYENGRYSVFCGKDKVPGLQTADLDAVLTYLAGYFKYWAESRIEDAQTA